MKLPFALIALLFMATLCRADMVIVQQVDGAGQSGNMTIKFNGTNLRVDVSPQVSMITDTATGDVTELLHDQKSYMVISASAAKLMMDQARAGMQSGTATAINPEPPRPTGKTDKINGYNAAEYVFNNGSLKATYWISSEFPNAKAVSAALAQMQKGALAAMSKGIMPDVTNLPGVAIKSDFDMAGTKFTSQLVSASDQPVDPGDYKVPPGYAQMALPTAQ